MRLDSCCLLTGVVVWSGYRSIMVVWSAKRDKHRYLLYRRRHGYLVKCAQCAARPLNGDCGSWRRRRGHFQYLGNSPSPSVLSAADRQVRPCSWRRFGISSAVQIEPLHWVEQGAVQCFPSCVQSINCCTGRPMPCASLARAGYRSKMTLLRPFARPECWLIFSA